jgi:hypothetical protein
MWRPCLNPLQCTVTKRSACGFQADRLLVFLDWNQDLYISSVLQPAPVKLLSSVQSFAWHDRVDILVAIADGRLTIWYYPRAAVENSALLAETQEQRVLSDGELATVESCSGRIIRIRQRSGVRKHACLGVLAIQLHELVREKRCVQHRAPQCMRVTEHM